MPTVDFRTQQFTPIGELVAGSGVPPGYKSRDGMSLRRVGSDGLTFSRAGSVVNSAEFTTSHVPMSALTEVFGLQVVVSSPDKKDASSSVKVQVSVDGTNYLWWNGAAWAAPAAGQFNTLAEFNENCSSLTINNPKSLGFKVQLNAVSSDRGNLAPTLHKIITYVEFDALTYLDLFSTFHGLITDVFTVPVTRRHVLANAADSFTLDSEYTTVAAGTFKVFNITTDPNKNSNLYSSYNANTRVITLTGQQAEGANLEVVFDGTAPVKVARADEAIEIAQIPVTLVTIEDTQEVMNKLVGNMSEYKLGTNTKLIRTRMHPTYRSAVVRIEHASRSPREALAGVVRLESALNYGVVLLATGEVLKVTVRSSAGLKDYPGQSHFSGEIEVMVSFFDHAPKFDEYPALGNLRINLGTGISNDSSDWSADVINVETEVT